MIALPRRVVVLLSGLLALIAMIAVLHANRLPATLEGQGAPSDRFVTVRGVRLHYVDWGGSGDAMLFLTGGGATAHSFDELAPHFTDRFHVLGLTRRGQGASDRPATGYDTATLAGDIKGFLDALNITRVTIVGFSIAGDEETYFAGHHPDRVQRLVYLDAAYDRKSNWELNQSSPFPPTVFRDEIGSAIAKGSREFAPDLFEGARPCLEHICGACWWVPAPTRDGRDDANQSGRVLPGLCRMDSTTNETVRESSEERRSR